MFLSKLSSAAALLAAAVLLTGAGLFVHQAFADKPGEPLAARADAPKADPPKDTPKDGDKPKEGPKDPDKPKEGPKDGDKPKEGPKDRGPGTVRTSIKEVHPGQNLLTVVTTKTEKGPALELTLDAVGTKITVSGKTAKLADLQPGMTAVVELSKDEKAAVSVQASWPSLFGTVKRIDAEKSTITLFGTDAQPEDRTFDLAGDAKATLEGIPATLADIEVKSRVTLEMSPDRKSVVLISGQGGKGLLRGVIAGVDAGKNSVTFMVGNEGATELSLDVAKDATVMIDGKAGKLADVAKGLRFVARLGPDKRTVITLSVASGRRGEDEK